MAVSPIFVCLMSTASSGGVGCSPLSLALLNRRRKSSKRLWCRRTTVAVLMRRRSCRQSTRGPERNIQRLGTVLVKGGCLPTSQVPGSDGPGEILPGEPA